MTGKLLKEGKLLEFQDQKAIEEAAEANKLKLGLDDGSHPVNTFNSTDSTSSIKTMEFEMEHRSNFTIYTYCSKKLVCFIIIKYLFCICCKMG